MSNPITECDKWAFQDLVVGDSLGEYFLVDLHLWGLAFNQKVRKALSIKNQ